MKKIILILVLVVGLFAEETSDIDVEYLLKAQKEASEVYTKDKNFYDSIWLLRVEGMPEIIKKKPKGITKEQYIQLLNDYGFYLTLTDKDVTSVERNFCEAKKALEKVKNLAPDRTSIYLNLGDLYWNIYFTFSYIRSHNSSFIRRYESVDCDFEPLIQIYPFKAKKMYLEYERRMKEEGEEKKIPARIRPILDNTKLFILIEDLWPSYRKSGDNLCADYVNTLNKLPEKEKTYCNRDISKVSKKFTVVDEKNIDKKNKNWMKYTQSAHPPAFKYRDTLIIDKYYLLYEDLNLNDNLVSQSCVYRLLNLDSTYSEVTKQSCVTIKNEKE